MVYRRYFRMDIRLSAILCLVWIHHGENCSIFKHRSWYAFSEEFESQIITNRAVSKNFCDCYRFGIGFWGFFVLSSPQLEASNHWYYKGCPITCADQCRAVHGRSYSFPIQWFLIGNTIGIYWYNDDATISDRFLAICHFAQSQTYLVRNILVERFFL